MHKSYSTKYYKPYHLVTTYVDHSYPITSCSVNDNKTLFASCSYDNTCIITDIETGKLIHKLQGHSSVVYRSSFSHKDSNLIATTSFDSLSKIWDVNKGNCLQTLKGHKMEVLEVSFNSSDTELATCSMDKTAKIWDTTTGLNKYTLNHKGEVVGVVYNKRDDIIATASFDYTSKIWDCKTGKLLFTLSEHKGEVMNCLFDNSGNQLVTGSADNSIKVWDIRKHNKSVTTFKKHLKNIENIYFNSNCSLLAVVNSFPCLVYDMKTLKLKHMLKGTENTNIVSFSPKNTFLITGTNEGIIIAWSIDKGECLQIEKDKKKEKIVDAHFVNEGRSLLVINDNINLWSYE